MSYVHGQYAGHNSMDMTDQSRNSLSIDGFYSRNSLDLEGWLGQTDEAAPKKPWTDNISKDLLLGLGLGITSMLVYTELKGGAKLAGRGIAAGARGLASGARSAASGARSAASGVSGAYRGVFSGLPPWAPLAVVGLGTLGVVAVIASGSSSDK